MMEYLSLSSVDKIRYDERLVLDGIESKLRDEAYPKFLTKIPFNNPYFEIQLNEIICGKNFGDAQMEELKEITQNKILVWRR
ncbi:hypothetical protein [Rufibacter sediminis]|nr:hypothetical protein [Rufibacter sediminis]